MYSRVWNALLLFLAILYSSEAGPAKKEISSPDATSSPGPISDAEADFNKFLDQACFTAHKGIVMAGLSKYLLTAAKNAYECLELCVTYGLNARPPVCCHAANFFGNKHSDPDVPEEELFLKSGACECYYSIGYAAESKKKSSIFLKRNSSTKCLYDDPNCPRMATLPPPPNLFGPGKKMTTTPPSNDLGNPDDKDQKVTMTR